jgi:hypothetical protein
MTRVRLTFEARQRFPDIGTRHGTATGSDTHTGGWYRVKWDGTDDVTWMRDEDIEPIQNEKTDISK